MPSKPHADRSRKAHSLCITAACAFVATVLAGCATDRLIATAPQGVDLSGEWQLNENLSDDPGRIGEEQQTEPPPPPKDNGATGPPGGFGRPGTTMPGMPTGPGGFGPGGGGDNLTSTGANSPPGFVPVLYAQATPATLPGSASDSDPPKAAAKPVGSVSRMLDAPQFLTISQSAAKLIVKSTDGATTDEYTAGEQRTIPFGKTEADRSAGWRDAAFVVVTKAKKGPSKEDDFALDSEGHLIFATLITHVKKGPIDFKRVYDRVRHPN